MELWSEDVCLWQKFFLFILPVILTRMKWEIEGKDITASII